MTHDEAFAALQARKRAEEALAGPRVTWRRVSSITGGGYSGLGPEGKLVFVEERPAGSWNFGDVVDGVRVVRGFAPTRKRAQSAAAALLRPEKKS